MSNKISKEKKPCWMVARRPFMESHYSDPDITFGPFKDQAEAEEFAKEGDKVFDANSLSFGERELMGFYS